MTTLLDRPTVEEGERRDVEASCMFRSEIFSVQLTHFTTAQTYPNEHW